MVLRKEVSTKRRGMQLVVVGKVGVPWHMSTVCFPQLAFDHGVDRAHP